MTQAKDIAKNLRKFMNDNNYTLSDLRKAQILILNGKMGDLGNGIARVEGRSSILVALEKPNAGLRMNTIDPEQEYCKT